MAGKWIGNYYDKIFWFDVETTGVDEKKNGIIQLAYCVEICGEVQEKGEIKMNPLKYKPEISQDALDVHGISEEEIKTYPDSMQGFQQLSEIFHRYTNKFTKADKFWVGGQNVKFDIGFLVELWRDMLGDKFYYLMGSLRMGAYLDTVNIAAMLQMMKVLPVTENRKLITLAQQVGLDFSEDTAHDAVADIMATRELFYKYMEVLEVPQPMYKIHKANL